MNLPKYSIPTDLKHAIKYSEDISSDEYIDKENKFSSVLNKLKNIDCLEIAEGHYIEFLKLGLYLEECQQRRDMSKYEAYRFVVERIDYCSNNKFKIYIKNFNGDNSVLNTSDSLKIFEQHAPNIVFFLKVKNIYKDHIVVSASNRFCQQYTCLAKYNIVITFNNYEFQCCHYALSVISSSMISDCLFPVKKTDNSVKPILKQYWFNRYVFNNPEQNQAVLNILSKSSFPAPYILYGPPGTGKTSTLVEAISQIWKLFNVYILICTPSNAACDVVTQRLLDYIPADNVYRIYSHTQEYSIINDDLKKCCNYDDDGTTDDLKNVDFFSKKIIVTTLCTSLRLKKLNLQFSYMFIDEAGQASQVEALLPLCTVKSSDCCQIVISGDHQQLGPSIRSKLAEPLLGQSVLEKLMKNEPYKKDEKTGYDPRYITKLIRNFRSNKEIIHTSNMLFYDNELIACRTKAKLNSFPVAFYAVEAMEEKAMNSKSSYNDEEIDIISTFTKNFIGKKVGGKIITEEDIGIVTPFRLQVSKIREKLDGIGLPDVDVGTVEIFQGKEKEIILITTVRSKTFIHDGVEHLGFLSNPKRFNVALTRAKTCLIVVGNPTALQINHYWRYFMRFCQENNACRGDPFEMRDENFYSLQELSIGNKIKKSIDLFDENFMISKIVDGQEQTLEMNNNFINKTSITTGDIKSINDNEKSIANFSFSVDDQKKNPEKNNNFIIKTSITAGDIKSINDNEKSIANFSFSIDGQKKTSEKNNNFISTTSITTGDIKSINDNEKSTANFSFSVDDQEETPEKNNNFIIKNSIITNDPTTINLNEKRNERNEISSFSAFSVNGQEKTFEKNNSFTKKTSITTDDIKKRLRNLQSISNRLIPVTSDSTPDSLINNTCFTQKASETSENSNSAKMDINSLQNSVATKGDRILLKDIYNFKNSLVSADIAIAVMNKSSLEQKNRLISGTTISDSLKNNIEPVNVNDKFSKCNSDDKEARIEFKKLLCSIL